MQDGDVVADQGVEPGTEAFLSDGAGRPGLGALLLVRQGDSDAAEAAPLLPQARLVLGLATFVLAAGRGSGRAGVRLGPRERFSCGGGTDVGGGWCLGPAVTAPHCLGGRFVDGLGVGCQAGSAEAAGAGEAELHAQWLGGVP